MSRISKAFVKSYTHPLITIEVIIAVGLLVSGLYTMSWFYEVSAITPIGKTIDSVEVRTSIGIFYTIAAVISLVGATTGKERINSSGLFLMFLSYSFMTILRLLSIGWTPLTWIFSVTIGLIVAFLYFRIRLLR